MYLLSVDVLNSKQNNMQPIKMKDKKIHFLLSHLWRYSGNTIKKQNKKKY